MKKNVWQPVDQHPELFTGQYVVPNFVSNSVAIKVTEKEYILISPGPSLIENWPMHFSDDCKLHIIFPNAYHHMGVSEWLKQFEKVSLYASKRAIKQLNKKGFSENTILALENQQPPLPENYYLSFPPGHRAGDVWVCKSKPNHQSIWITCDSFLNYQRLSNQPIARFLQKWLNAAPGLKISQVVKWFILSNRRSFKAWVLERLKEENPTTLIPSHGEVKDDDGLAMEIQQIIQARL